MKNGELKIEKGIPLPPKKTGPVPGALTQLLRKLRIGESIFVPGKKSAVNGGAIRSAGMTGRCAQRAMNGGTRIWRIK